MGEKRLGVQEAEGQRRNVRHAQLRQERDMYRLRLAARSDAGLPGQSRAEAREAEDVSGQVPSQIAVAAAASPACGRVRARLAVPRQRKTADYVTVRVLLNSSRFCLWRAVTIWQSWGQAV